MARVKACDPPCESSTCYGCNAAARDLAVNAKRAGRTMQDLPSWAAWRVRRMAVQTAQAQALSDAYSASREHRSATAAYSGRMKTNDTTWVCARCQQEQAESIEKYIRAQRRYCPSCALPFQAQDAERAQETLIAAERLAAETRRLDLMRAQQRAAIEASGNQCTGSTMSGRPCALAHGHAGEHRWQVDQRETSRWDRVSRAGEMAQADSQRAQEAGASLAGATAQLGAASAAQEVSKENAKPLADRFQLIELDEPGEVQKEVEKTEEKFNRPIEID